LFKVNGLQLDKGILVSTGFHFVVESFGEAVIAGKAPHGGDLLLPSLQSLPELDQLRLDERTEDLPALRGLQVPCMRSDKP
jgi:hypothetical protein